MNEKTKKEYLKNPHFCPVCASTDISTDNWDPEIQFQTVECNQCEARWKEIFEMVSIEME